jgi:hypothetical protein
MCIKVFIVILLTLITPASALAANTGAMDYYPVSVDSDGSVRKYYSDLLSSSNEPNLYRMNARKQGLRFVWIRSFHNAIIIRFDNDAEPGSVIVKEVKKLTKFVNGRSFEKFRCVKKKRVNLTNIQTKKIVQQACELVLAKQVDNANGDYGYDGSTWIVDGFHDGKYFVRVAHNPSNNTLMGTLGRSVLKETDSLPPPNETY